MSGGGVESGDAGGGGGLVLLLVVVVLPLLLVLLLLLLLQLFLSLLCIFLPSFIGKKIEERRPYKLFLSPFLHFLRYFLFPQFFIISFVQENAPKKQPGFAR